MQDVVRFFAARLAQIVCIDFLEQRVLVALANRFGLVLIVQGFGAQAAQVHKVCLLYTSVLLISHRLANVTGADLIYVLEQGAVVQSGTHAQLTGEKGLYRRLWNSQQALENDLEQEDAV